MDNKNISKKLNILITAHELSPVLGSECGAAWNIVTRLAKYHNITILYARTNQFGTNNYEADVSSYIKGNFLENIKFIAIDQPRETKFIASLNKIISHNKSNVGNPILYFLGVRYWEKSAYRKV